LELATEIRLPQLGQTMEEGTIVEYKVKIGDKVEKGDSIYEVETDKATLEVESPADGFVKHIIAEVGQTLLVGDPILLLGDKDEQVPQSLVDSLKAETAGDQAQAADGQAASALEDTDPGEPVETPIPTTARQVKLGDVIPLTRRQKTAAQKMLQSKREIPCFHLTAKADVTELVELRTRLNSTSNVKISYNDFVMRALATGLEKYPIMTGRLEADTIKLADSINIGLAIALADGMVVPVVKDVNKKDLAQIARDSRALIERIRTNKLTPEDFQGGCITISNLGAFGAEANTAIVVPGQGSILGVGQITDKCGPGDIKSARAEAANVAVLKSMNLTLSVDHRLTNGAYAAQFLDFTRRLLEDPSSFES
jgi:pyruvate dehydrogenase E2 component (dihydrolipoamide acetyltransferase)